MVYAPDARQVRRRFVVLSALRWLPVGLLIPVTVLLMLDRGLSLGQIGLAVAAQGAVVFVLELPTGGLADAIGRRITLLAGAAVGLVALGVLTVATTLPLLAAYYALMGIFRALDSGPLDAWYVDAALAADGDADIEGGLAAGAAALSAAIAVGALLSGGLVAVAGATGLEPLAVPVIAALVLQLVDVVAIAVLVVEPPRQRVATGPKATAVPAVVRGALRLVRGSPVLLALVGVELLWGFGMTAFETLMPPRLAEVTGARSTAAALLGPVASAAWLASAAGAAAIPLAVRRWGAVGSAVAMHVLQAATVAAMAVAAGPAGLIVAYLATYALHGAANPVHQGLLHRQVTGTHRTTVLSLNSMMSQPGGALGAVVLGRIADAVDTPTAMLVGAVVLALAAPLYLPARRTPRFSLESDSGLAVSKENRGVGGQVPAGTSETPAATRRAQP